MSLDNIDTSILKQEEDLLKKLMIKPPKVFRSRRSQSCPPTFRRFELLKDPSALTADDLKTIVRRENQIDSESTVRYCYGGYMPVGYKQCIGRNNEFQILRKMGWGNFSTVWLCRHRLQNQEYYAVKIARANHKLRSGMFEEIRTLTEINEGDPDHVGYNRIIFFHSFFREWSINGSHICLVFEAMGPSLFEILAKDRFRGIYEPCVKVIIKQVLEGLQYLHEVCQLIHADLKPENILVVPNNESAFSDMVTYVNRFEELGVPFPRTYVTAIQEGNYTGINDDVEDFTLEDNTSKFLSLPVKRLEYPRSSETHHKLIFMNPNVKVKIADLGNACTLDQQFPVIQTLQYRALEVLIQAGYSFPADIWSLGCIAFELCTGEYLFAPKVYPNLSPTAHHLSLIWEALGEIPKEVALKGLKSSEYFHSTGTLRSVGEATQNIWKIEDVLIDKFQWSREKASTFADFVNSLVEPFVELRETASSALTHEWINNIEE